MRCRFLISLLAVVGPGVSAGEAYGSLREIWHRPDRIPDEIRRETEKLAFP